MKLNFLACCYVQPHLRTLRTCSPENICRKTQLDCPHHYPATLKEAPRCSFTKIKVPPAKRSLLSLEYASKEAKQEPPSSAHLRENDKDPQEALRSNETPQTPDGLRQGTRGSDVQSGRNHTQDNDDIIPRPCAPKKWPDTGRESFIGGALTKTPHYLFLLLAALKESPSPKHQHLSRLKPEDMTR